ncbi:MAG: hypothetical protein KJZ52_10085, partial [Anaerolineales bacterium]|nr:hypothetical protein [Anaerolineales bacterium]
MPYPDRADDLYGGHFPNLDLSGLLMTLAQILILAVVAILINSLRAWRSGAMLAASVLAVYWLQPRQALDSLTFWLPTILFVISVGVWAATSSFESQERRENWAALAILIAT